MLKKSLNKLVDTMKERNTVLEIVQAKDVKGVYSSEKVAMSKQLQDFKDLAMTQINLDENPIEKADEIICPGVALEVSFIMVMCKLDPYEVFSDGGRELYKSLQNVRGKYEGLASNFGKFFRKEWHLKTVSEEYALKKIFLL